MELRNRVNYSLQLSAFMSTPGIYILLSSPNTALASFPPHLVTWGQYSIINRVMELRNRVNCSLQLSPFMSTPGIYIHQSSANTALASFQPHFVTMVLRNQVNYRLQLLAFMSTPGIYIHQSSPNTAFASIPPHFVTLRY